MSDAAFAIRPMRPSDEPFVYKAWLTGYWPHFPGRIIISECEFMQRWHRVIERILADKKTRTVVAHVEGEPDALLGFACGSDACLHWAYVKQAFRRMRIAETMLLEFPHQATEHHSHWHDRIDGIDRDYCPDALKEYAL